MNVTEIENKLREIFLPVFGLTSTDEIPAQASLVNDIGADSLDFVEITYLVEREFGVTLKPGELLTGGAGFAGGADVAGGATTGGGKITAEDLFAEGHLTSSGARVLKDLFPETGDRFTEGMTKIDLFRSITVRDLAETIRRNIYSSGETQC